MSKKPTGKKILALFVLAFLCLNVGGFLCLSFCHQMMAASAMTLDAHLSEHCRRAKKEAEEKEQGSAKIGADAASCCIMPVSMFAAPVEKQSRFVDILVADATPAPTVDFYKFFALSLPRLHILEAPVYRPPPLDRRVERILNCVIRI